MNINKTGLNSKSFSGSGFDIVSPGTEKPPVLDLYEKKTTG